MPHTEECDNCEGRGWVVVETDEDQLEEDEEVQEDCDECDGTGFIRYESESEDESSDN